MIKFLANENFPYSSVLILRDSNYDVSYIGTDFSGISDAEVISLAINENRVILTFDRDYGELIFKKNLKPADGVIYFRWNSFSPNEPGIYLIKLLQSVEINFYGKLTVISRDSIRQKKYI